VAVGEESGRLEQFLERAADLCEERAERILQRLIAFAEPGMILVFGILVAFVALSLLQALYGIDAGAFR
jgi:type II secretory pathway component PulF